MTEGDLKQQLVIELKKQMYGAIVLRHEEIFRAGVPDISVTWNKVTSWWEVKHVNPRLTGRGLQKLTCLQLSQVGICWYVIYRDVGGLKETRIVEPRLLDSLETPHAWPGYNHGFVADFVKRKHVDHHR